VSTLKEPDNRPDDPADSLAGQRPIATESIGHIYGHYGDTLRTSGFLQRLAEIESGTSVVPVNQPSKKRTAAVDQPLSVHGDTSH
jgi:hypothetical protein